MAGVLAGQIRWRTMSLSKSLPTAHKSRPSTPSEAGSLLSSKRSQSSGDHFDLNREMGRIRERLGNASLAERKMAATPVKKKLERVPTPGGTTLAYTPTKSPEYKKIKVEPIAQAAKAPGHNASPPVSTRSASAAAGDGTGALARKDTTQLEAEKRDQTLHEKYRNDPDCIFLPCGGVKFIGPKGREENEREHLERLQHNADMRFQRSFKSPSCPQAIVELWSKRKSNPSVVPLLFEDFVQSGENWLQASLVVSSTRTSTQKRKGRYVLLPYRDVKQRFGPAIAGSILATKKELEKNKSPSDATVYWMEHPDAPGVEDWSLVRVWDAMEFEDEHADSSSVGVEGRGDFDLGQSKDILSKALGPHMDKFKSLTFGGGSHEGEGSLPPDGNVPGKKEPKVQPMSKRLSKYISQCSTKMTDVLAWKSKLDENKTGLTDVLVNGFRHELDARLSDMKSSRIELERLYALRVDDEKLDDPIHLQYKEDSMKALRGADAAFNSYAGSIRSIKNVLDPKPKAKAKAKAKAKSDPPGPGDVEEPAAPNA
eukprot:s3511_g3.t1